MFFLSPLFIVVVIFFSILFYSSIMSYTTIVYLHQRMCTVAIKMLLRRFSTLCFGSLLFIFSSNIIHPINHLKNWFLEFVLPNSHGPCQAEKRTLFVAANLSMPFKSLSVFSINPCFYFIYSIDFCFLAEKIVRRTNFSIFYTNLFVSNRSF